jgi:hypothetical protein
MRSNQRITYNAKTNINNRAKMPNNRKRRFFKRIPNKSNNTNAFQFTQLRREIDKLSRDLKTTSLGSGPLTNINTATNSNANNPSINKKEIRHDILYDAFELYKMGKYYSFYKTPSLIIRLPVYTTLTITTVINTSTRLMWFPYAYPYINADVYRIGINSDVIPNIFSNIMVSGTTSNGFKPVSQVDIPGNYRLLCASMKITNITTNTNKGGAYTVYKTTRSEGQPVVYNSGIQYETNVPPYTTDLALMEQNYDQEPIKYLFNANQTAQVDEYNVIQGNTIFQGDNEYMGARTEPITAYNILPIGQKPILFNPQGINVKYVVHIDAINNVQTYKIQTLAIFEVSPRPGTSISAIAYKVDRTVLPDVILKAKNYFPIHSVMG